MDECADATLLKSAERPPADPAARTRVDELRQKLAHVRALNKTGDFDAALAPVNELVDGAKQVGYRPLLAETYLERGQVRERLGDFDPALADLREAVRAALAGRRDDLVVSGLTSQMWIQGVRLQRRAEAHEMARDAEAAMERLAARDVARARLLRNEGVIFFLEAKYDDARERAERALALYDKTPDEGGRVGVLTDLGERRRGATTRH